MVGRHDIFKSGSVKLWSLRSSSWSIGWNKIRSRWRVRRVAWGRYRNIRQWKGIACRWCTFRGIARNWFGGRTGGWTSRTRRRDWGKRARNRQWRGLVKQWITEYNYNRRGCVFRSYKWIIWGQSCKSRGWRCNRSNKLRFKTYLRNWNSTCRWAGQSARVKWKQWRVRLTHSRLRRINSTYDWSQPARRKSFWRIWITSGINRGNTGTNTKQWWSTSIRWALNKWFIVWYRNWSSFPWGRWFPLDYRQSDHYQ